MRATLNKIIPALLFLFLINAFPAKAQVPGYLGKKLTIAYNLYTFPAISYPTNDQKSGMIGLNTRHAIEADYVIGLHTTAGFSVQFASSGVAFDKGFTLPIQLGNEIAYVSGSFDSYGKLNIFNPGIFFKFFSDDLLAPIGSYTRLDLFLSVNTITYEKEDFSYQLNNTTNPLYLDMGPRVSKNTVPGIGLTFGKQWVVKDLVTFDFGVQGALILVPEVISGEENRLDKHSYHVVTPALVRSFYHQLLNVKLGIGLLAL